MKNLENSGAKFGTEQEIWQKAEGKRQKVRYFWVVVSAVKSVRWQPGIVLPPPTHPGGEEIFVLLTAH